MKENEIIHPWEADSIRIKVEEMVTFVTDVTTSQLQPRINNRCWF